MNTPRYLSITHQLYSHVLGRGHSHKHRMVAGGIVMFFGVVLAKSASHYPSLWVHVIADGIGYFMHAVGGLPFIELIEQEKARALTESVKRTCSPRRIWLWIRVRTRRIGQAFMALWWPHSIPQAMFSIWWYLTLGMVTLLTTTLILSN